MHSWMMAGHRDNATAKELRRTLYQTRRKIQPLRVHVLAVDFDGRAFRTAIDNGIRCAPREHTSMIEWA